MSETWIIGSTYRGHSTNGGLVSWRRRLNGWRRVSCKSDAQPATLRNWMNTRFDGGSLTRKVHPEWAREMAAAYMPPDAASIKFRPRPMVLHHHDGHMDGGPVGRQNRQR